jgi:hypothetical protein
MQPTMDACAWIHQAQDRSWRPYVLRAPDAAMRTSLSHVYYPLQFSYDGDFNRRRGLYIKEGQPQDARSIMFFQDRPLPCPKHVGATATIFVAAQPTGTSPREDNGRLLPLPFQDLLQAGTEVSAPEGARQIQQGPQPKEPRPEG